MQEGCGTAWWKHVCAQAKRDVGAQKASTSRVPLEKVVRISDRGLAFFSLYRKWSHDCDSFATELELVDQASLLMMCTPRNAVFLNLCCSQYNEHKKMFTYRFWFQVSLT